MSRPGPYTTTALLSDALSLGTHWVYDQEQLTDTISAEGLTLADPLSPYHPNRSAGQFTHYGDQVVTLWQSLQKNEGWDQADFLRAYRESWVDYDGYLDGATKTTLQHLSDPQAPPSTAPDLAGVTRIAPFFDYYTLEQPEEVIQRVRQYISLTHDDPLTLAVGAFMVRAVMELQRGTNLTASLERAAAVQDDPSYFQSTLEEAKKAAASGVTTQEQAQRYGLACQTTQGFPLVLFLALRAQGDLTLALRENNYAGGENAARAGLLSLLHTPFITAKKPLLNHWLKRWEELEIAKSVSL